MKKHSSIHGVPCSIGDKGLRAAIAQVLTQVRVGFPKDYARVKSRLATIAYLQSRWDGTWGEIKLSPGRRPDLETADVESLNTYYLACTPYWQGGEGPCVMLLARRLRFEERSRQLGTVAHELGHVATRAEDAARRHAPTDEWASETAADWYAYRWGFGPAIRAHAGTRAFTHHACLPGRWIERDYTAEYGGPKRWSLSRHFVFNEIPACSHSPSGNR